MKYSAGSFRERKQKVMLKLTKTSLLNFTCFLMQQLNIVYLMVLQGFDI